ncbi:protogenin B [Puntigrus tetrazona]|uniref:protogenin B n=1 Tax=Puntigrus tetrazona TaxID=1606681 RepID=UPI001C89DD18|nr:protogenin B [Puntigrus tetrazona]
MGSVTRSTLQRGLILLWILSFSGALAFSELSFTVEPEDVSASAAQAVLLDCQARGEASVGVRWRRNGVRLQESVRLRVLSNGSLFISSSAPADRGFYRCLAHNRYGAVLSRRARLTVTDVPLFISHPVSAEVSLGSVVRFSCAVDASAVISWELNQRSLPLDSDRITSLPNGVLQIRDVTMRDAGNYRCLATNTAGRVRSREAELTIVPASGPRPLSTPHIIAGPQNISAGLGQSAVLECLAEGNPRPLVSWSRADSKPIDVSGARVLGNGNLIISAVKAHHSGSYLCRATTPGTRNYTAAAGNLTVLVPPTLVEKPESQTRPRAGTARFSCQAEGTPVPQITWFKNGQVIHSNGRTKMYNNKLVITQIIPEDDAFYQCQAENSQGSVVSTSRLIVVLSEDRPSAPRNIHAETISSSAILLAWERPQYNADKVIAYSIHYMKSEGLNNEEYQAVIGNDTTSHIVDDLEPARNYTFYIVAYMPMGASRMSEQVTQHTLEDVPLRTPELSLTSRSPTDIQVSWQPLPPKLSRGRVSAYRLSYRTASDEQVTSVELPVPSENCTQHLLQGLQPDTIYLIRMSASTRVGWSQPSAWNSHRTPKTSSATVPPAPSLDPEPLNCTSVTVRWRPAPSDAVVQGYKLTFHPDGQSEDSLLQLPPQDQQHFITGLHPRVKYHVKLLAFSANGDGYEAHQTVSTPACPSAPNRRLAALPSPDHLHASVNSSSAVRLSWSRPAFSSGRPLSYSIRYGPLSPSEAPSVRYLQTSGQTLTVTGLRPNTRYEFAVRLHVDQMSSPWSAAAYQRTLLEAPWSPPRSVRVSLIEDGTALVSWKRPDQPDLSVSHYTVLYASQSSWLAGDWQVLQREGSNTMALLEKLESGSVYLVKISASNPAGDGPFSSAVELRIRSKSPRDTERHGQNTAFLDGLYHLDGRSVPGVVVGVCIALSCIILCIFILLSKSRTPKSASSKMIGRVGSDVTRSAASPANQQPGENAEVLLPMMRTHFIDAKGGTNLLINRAGPITSDAQSKRKKGSMFNNNQKSNANKSTVLQTVSSDVGVGPMEDPANLHEVGKTVLRYEDELSRDYRPLCDSETSQTSGADSGNFSNDEMEAANPSRTSYESDGEASNECVASVCARIPGQTPKSRSRLQVAAL